jgi:hypothetical protein
MRLNPLLQQTATQPAQLKPQPSPKMPSTYYDPDVAPNPLEWLQMSETERIRLVKNHHADARVKLPNVKMHAMFHVIVETQVAHGFRPTIRALERLQAEGLSRHESIHAVASTVAEHAFDMQRSVQPQDSRETQLRLNAAIEALSAEVWSRQGSDG